MTSRLCVGEPGTDSPGPPRIAALLFDHGSRLRAPQRVLGEALCGVAERIGRETHALLRASMEEIEPWHWLPNKLREAVEDYAADIVIGIPFFLFAGRHMSEDNPRTFGELQAAYPRVLFALARPLMAEPDLAEVLLARIRAARAARPLDPKRSAVILTAHGNRDSCVAQLRQPILERVAAELAPEVAAVREAVLRFEQERLLELRLREACSRGWTDILIAPLFLAPGRYIEEFIPEVVAAVRREHPELEARLAEPIGGGPDVADVLARRFREARARALSRWPPGVTVD